MFLMRYTHKVRCLVQFIIVCFCVTPLIWIYRPDRTFQLMIQSNKVFRNLSVSLDLAQPAAAPQCDSIKIVPYGQKALINGTKTVLLSAYLEHRFPKRQVRVLALVLRSEKVGYRCILCCHGKQHFSDGSRYIHYDHFGFRYGVADIMCHIPSECGTPSHITVTPAEGGTGDIIEKEFFEVQNQKAKQDSYPFNFTVCYSTMFNYNNVLQLVQNFEMLQLMGVNRVAIYRTSNSPEIQRILDYYTQKGFLEVIPWSLSKFMTVSKSWLPHLGPGDIHYYGQIPALNDCLYRYMYQSRYVAQHDTDELILPRTVDSWSEMLPLLERKYGAGRCFIFGNYVFPNTINLPPPGATALPPPSSCCPEWQFVPGVNILSHLYHEAINSRNTYNNFKIMFNPRNVFAASVHGLINPQNGCTWVDRRLARLHHTRKPRNSKMSQKWLVYDDRLLNYSSPLIMAVNTVLTETGFILQDSSM